MKGTGDSQNQTSELLKYFCQFKPIHFRKGDIVQRPDFPSQSVFYLEKGCVKKYTVTNDGEEKLSVIYSQGSIFPLMNLFQNSVKNFYTKVMLDTTLRPADENQFRDYLKDNPKAALEFVDYLIKHTEMCYQRIGNLGFIASRSRIICQILYLADRFGIACKDGLTFSIPISQKEIANMTAMTRETVGRELEKLHKEGLIEYKNKNLVINDIDRLIKKMDSYEEINWQLN